MFTRTLILSACLMLTSGYLVRAQRSDPLPPRTSFSNFPAQMEQWSSRPAPAFDPRVLAVLGVDEFVNRYYVTGNRLAHLYIGYYRSQRQGSSIHSPMNCLPGAGWLPVAEGRIDIPVTMSAISGGVARTISVNRLVVQKGLDKQLVLYWYQSHGRAIPSDYMSKMYLVLDSIRLSRTDAALIRVVTPINESGQAPDAVAEQTATDVVKAMFPLLEGYLPS
jgi:EpsI family protein